MGITETLFSRLERYSLNQRKTSREDIFTELLAYFLEADMPFRNRFLRMIFPSSPRLVRRYLRADILTQHRISKSSRMDLVFFAAKSLLCLENKIDSQEGWTETPRGPAVGQVSKYLKLLRSCDHLIYLTKRTSPSPKFRQSARNTRIFLGQYYWDDVGVLLRHAGNDGDGQVRRLFLDYMEATGMGAMKGFTKKELREARSAFPFILKGERLLKLVWPGVSDELKSWLGKSSATEGVQHSSYHYSNMYCRYAVRSRGLHIYLTLYVKDDNQVCLSFGPGAWKKQVVSELTRDENIQAKRKLLERMGWESDTNPSWWEISRSFTIKPRPLEELRDELLPKLLKAVADLKSSRIAPMIERRTKWLG